MTETLLLWGKCACMALHFTALIGAFAGVMLWGGSFGEDDRKGIKAGAWMLAVSVLLLAALPWWPVWDAWIEMARKP